MTTRLDWHVSHALGQCMVMGVLQSHRILFPDRPLATPEIKRRAGIAVTSRLSTLADQGLVERVGMTCRGANLWALTPKGVAWTSLTSRTP